MSRNEFLEKYEDGRRWLRAFLLSGISRFSNIIGEYIALVKANVREYNEMVVDEAIELLSMTTGILLGSEQEKERTAEKAVKMLERVLRRDARIFRRLSGECMYSSSGQAATPTTTQ